MTIDMTAVLLDVDDRPIVDQAGIQRIEDMAGAPPLTLGRAVMHALFSAPPEERDVLPEEKWARAALAMQIRDDPAAELTAEQIAKIKRLLGRLYGGLIIMRAFPLLDPNVKVPELT